MNANNKISCLESIDTFKISFAGKNSIDAEIFTTVINNTIDLVKASANVIEPAAFLRLEIKANKEGSFESILEVVVKYGKDLLTQHHVEIACEILGGFLTFLKIKKHLKGRKPRELKNKEDVTIITNQDGQVINAPQKIANAFFNDSKIDNSVIKIFCSVNGSDRESLKVEKNGEIINFDKDEFEEMSNKIVDESGQEIETREDEQKISNCELIIKKPDLIGNSKWELIFDKVIYARIEDSAFIKQVKNGKIKISGGYKLVCELSIKREIDENFNLVNTEYTILKVTGVKNGEEQMEIDLN